MMWMSSVQNVASILPSFHSSQLVIVQSTVLTATAIDAAKSKTFKDSVSKDAEFFYLKNYELLKGSFFVSIDKFYKYVYAKFAWVPPSTLALSSPEG